LKTINCRKRIKGISIVYSFEQKRGRKLNSCKDLDGKFSIITGGGSGVGQRTSTLFAEHGSRVCIIDFDEDAGKRTLDIIKTFDEKCMFLKADVSRSKEIRRAIDEVKKTYARIDILVNCAGIYSTGPKAKNIIEITEEEWDKIIDINLKGVFLTSKFVIPSMISKKKGVIINIASEVAKYGLPNISAYSASKGGVYALTKQMAIELSKYGIRVNSVSPGPLYTPMHEKRFRSLAEEGTRMRESFLRAERVPLGRPGTPEDIAYAILYLASDRACYVTGADFPVDGGSTSSPGWRREE
jgi:NAD(P)-dependent dehydrogenase (short-subunit alcohol dehydrogenase family)